MNEKKENNMYYQTNIKPLRNEDISFLQLSYGNFVSLDDYMLLKKENQQLKDIISRTKDELYIWGEILNPEFQKKMLEILETE